MGSIQTDSKETSYKELLSELLEYAPGGGSFHPDRFDLTAYKAQCLKLKPLHIQERVNVLGHASSIETSWGWTDQQWVMYFLSPINLTQIRIQLH